MTFPVDGILLIDKDSEQVVVARNPKYRPEQLGALADKRPMLNTQPLSVLQEQRRQAAFEGSKWIAPLALGLYGLMYAAAGIMPLVWTTFTCALCFLTIVVLSRRYGPTPALDELNDANLLVARGDPQLMAACSTASVPTVLVCDGRRKGMVSLDGLYRIVPAPARSGHLVRAVEEMLSGSRTLAPVRPHFPGKRVLVVDDNAVNRMVARAMLTSLGLEVTLASSGADALEAAAETAFDVVLMDCQMPDMDGYETTRRLTGQLGADCPPIIALTASVSPEDRARALASGMVDYLGKPLPIETLVGLLHHWFSSDLKGVG